MQGRERARREVTCVVAEIPSSDYAESEAILAIFRTKAFNKGQAGQGHTLDENIISHNVELQGRTENIFALVNLPGVFLGAVAAESFNNF